MMLVVIDLDVLLRKFERKPSSIKFGKLRAYRDQQVALQKKLLNDSQASDAAHRQRMVIGNGSFATGGWHYRSIGRLSQTLERDSEIPLQSTGTGKDDWRLSLLT